MDPIPLGAIPAHYAARFGPDRIALTHPEGALTWDELDRRANQRARALGQAGVGENDYVCIALPNGNHFYESSFAIWKLGATPLVVSSKLPIAELKAIVELGEPKLVIGAETADLPGFRCLPADFSAQKFSDDPVPVRIATHWKAMTSGGSTGRPKIIVDHNPAAVTPDEDFLFMPRDSCVLNPGPLYHNAPFVFAHHGLFRGNHVVGMARFDPLESLRLIEKHRVTWVMMVPTMMQRIWRLPEAERAAIDMSSLDIVSHVASPMPAWLKENWIDWLGPDVVCELYGGTEATGATWITGTEWLEHRGSVGKCVRESRVRILGENGKDLPAGEIGEIYMMPAGGYATTYHYIGAARRETTDGWESLGDIGWLDDDGYLYLADRRTDLILSGGANINPAEVESALGEHPGVNTAVAIGLPDDDLGQRVHAIVQPHPDWDGAVDEATLRPFMEERLARYKTPRSYEFVTFPLRDDAGKVRRSQLREERM